MKPSFTPLELQQRLKDLCGLRTPDAFSFAEDLEAFQLHKPYLHLEINELRARFQSTLEHEKKASPTTTYRFIQTRYRLFAFYLLETLRRPDLIPFENNTGYELPEYLDVIAGLQPRDLLSVFIESEFFPDEGSESPIKLGIFQHMSLLLLYFLMDCEDEESSPSEPVSESLEENRIKAEEEEEKEDDDEDEGDDDDDGFDFDDDDDRGDDRPPHPNTHNRFRSSWRTHSSGHLVRA